MNHFVLEMNKKQHELVLALKINVKTSNEHFLVQKTNFSTQKHGSVLKMNINTQKQLF